MKSDSTKWTARSLARVMRLSGFTALILAALLPCPAAAQAPSTAANDAKGVIRGVITDATQAVVPGATATLSRQGGTSQQMQTDDKGAYSFAAIEAGSYSLSITAPNFATKLLDNI